MSPYTALSKAFSEHLCGLGFDVCRSRVQRISGAGEDPSILISKGQIAREKGCRNGMKSVVGLRFTVIGDSGDCTPCDPDLSDVFDDFVEGLHEAIAEAKEIELEEPFTFEGFTGQSIEIDDPNIEKSDKVLLTILEMSFSVYKEK